MAFDKISSDTESNLLGREFIKENSRILKALTYDPGTLGNSLLMSAMVCSIVNNGQ